jgi:hypothetical protein
MPARHSNSLSTLKIACSLGLIAVALMVVNVIMSARVAQDGLAIDELVKREATLKMDITLLEQQLLTTTSLQELSQKAGELGYQPPAELISLNAGARIAQF